MKEVNAPNCGRENDLIAFLYGELNDEESRTFQQHVHSCAACSTELGSLQAVRESVVAWRNESLGGVISPAQTAGSLPTRLVLEKPSALAALREFFNLAPLWMKGAVAFASILFCLFAGLAITRLRDTPPVVVATPGENASSKEQLNALVEQRVQEELRRIKSSTEEAPPSPVIVTNADQNTRRRGRKYGSEVATNQKRPLSKTEREQLAADLRLISAKNESELDLLDDGINQ